MGRREKSSSKGEVVLFLFNKKKKKAMKIKDLLISLVQEIVDNPADVDVQETDGEFGKVYEIALHKEDVGKVIGKKGRTISSLRTLFKGIAKKQGFSLELEIVE